MAGRFAHKVSQPPVVGEIVADHRRLRGRGRTALLVSHVSIALPFLLGVLAEYGRLAPPGISYSALALFLGVSMSVTALPVLIRILVDLGLALVVALVTASSALGAFGTLALTGVFVAVLMFVLRPALVPVSHASMLPRSQHRPTASARRDAGTRAIASGSRSTKSPRSSCGGALAARASSASSRARRSGRSGGRLARSHRAPSTVLTSTAASAAASAYPAAYAAASAGARPARARSCRAARRTAGRRCRAGIDPIARTASVDALRAAATRSYSGEVAGGIPAMLSTDVPEPSYLHSRDVSIAVFQRGPVRRDQPVPRVPGLADALEPWEDSPKGRPQGFGEGDPMFHQFSLDGRPIAQWGRLKAGHTDDIGS